MRMIKKFIISLLSLLLAVIMAAGTIAVSAASPTEGKCGPSLTWKFDSSAGILTISGEGPMYDYANFSDAVDCAPYSIYRGKIKYLIIEEGVTKIGTYAFAGFTVLVDVSFPESTLSEIGAYAFNYCIVLPRMIVPDCVTEIGEYAFTTCQKMVMIRFGNGITELPEGACRRGFELTDVYLPEGCKVLGNAAFYECKKLVNIDISHVEKIAPNCFMSCTSLKSVSFGENIKTVGYNSFYACEALSEVIFDGTPDMIASNFSYGSAWHNSHAEGIYTICDGTILMCKGIYAGTELIVPDGVKIISESVFANNQNITSVTLPEGLEVIGNTAFSRVDKLMGIYVPESVREIGNAALGYMTEGTANSTVNPNYVITGKGNGVAYRYAAENGINYNCLHEYEYVTQIQNCTEKIYTVKKCSLCGIVTEKTESEANESHSYTETVISPTCTEGGYTVFECEKCDYSYTGNETASSGHTSSEKWEITVLPDCEEYGKISVLCLDCGMALEEKLIDKKGHTPSETLRTVSEGSCTDGGIYERYCTDCKETLETITSPAAGHTPEAGWTTVIPSTDGSAGYEILLCSVCKTAIETRWFTFENGEKLLLENSEARFMCKQRLEEAFSGTVSVWGADSLDYNCDGRIDVKDSIAMKRLTEDKTTDSKTFEIN